MKYFLWPFVSLYNSRRISGSVVVALLIIIAPIACGGYVFCPCFVIQYIVSA